MYPCPPPNRSTVRALMSSSWRRVRRRAASTRSHSASTSCRSIGMRKIGSSWCCSTKARATATPGAPPTPVTEPAGDQCHQSFHRLLLVLAGGADGQLAPRGGTEKENPQDALPVDGRAVLADRDPGAELGGRSHELGGGGGMEGQREYGHPLGGH